MHLSFKEAGTEVEIKRMKEGKKGLGSQDDDDLEDDDGKY
jgi:hypothetical protein